MKEKDKILLCHLRSNARIPLTILSRKTKIPVSTLYDRIKINENNKIIKKHTTLINFEKIGFPIRVFIELNIENNDNNEFIKFVKTNENVNSAYKISNKYNYFIYGVFKTLKEVDIFIQKIDSKFKIKDIDMHFVIDEISEEQFLSNENLLLLMGN